MLSKSKHLGSLEIRRTLILRSVYLFHYSTPPTPLPPTHQLSAFPEDGTEGLKLSQERFKLAPVRGFITKFVKYQEGFLCWVLNFGLYWKVNTPGSNLHQSNTCKMETMNYLAIQVRNGFLKPNHCLNFSFYTMQYICWVLKWHCAGSDQDLKTVITNKQKTKCCTGDAIRSQFRWPKGWHLAAEKL